MSLNVTIQDVPFAILEAVKARILAQRAQRQQQATPRAPSGPRPQFRRFGASSKVYRRPRPAALPDTGEIGFVLGPSSGYVNGELEVTADEFEPMAFSRHLGTTELNSGIPVINFGVTDGPIASAKAVFAGVFQSESFVTVHGYAFASRFASDSLLDMRIAGQPIGGLNMRLNFHDSRPSANETITELPELLNPDARAGFYDSYTFEFICQPAGSGLAVFFNNALFAFDYAPFLPAVDFDVTVCGVQSVSTTKGELDAERNTFEITITSDPRQGPDDPELLIQHLPLGTWSHVALVKNDQQIRFYLNGVLMFSAVATEDYWDRACLQFEDLSNVRYAHRNGDLPLMVAVTAQTISGSDIDNAKVHGLRFTPQALYTGASFTPPTSITELA